MPVSRVIRKSVCLLAILCVACLAGCATQPRPKVQNFDTYQIVHIGPASYLTHEGLRVVHQERGMVEHVDDSLPGTVIQVELEADPPRSLKFDADQKRRALLLETPNSRLTSVQYDAVDDTRFVKIFARGLTENQEELFANLILVRKGGETVVLKIVGPLADEIAITRLGERLSRNITIAP